MSSLAETNLFKPIKVGPVTLTNRVVLAPTTRLRNTETLVATDSMLEFYIERARNNGGLLISEGAFTSPDVGSFPFAPMLYTAELVFSWKKITDAVHPNGSSIAIQIAGLGRAGDPKDFKDGGFPFAAPSAIYLTEDSKEVAEKVGNLLREFTIDDLHRVKDDFISAAKRSVDRAGFDIVELHAANMFLLNQFLEEASNQRTDQYGGSIENRSRFVLEVVDGVIEAVGADRTAVRISRYCRSQGGESVDAKVSPIVNYGYFVNELERRAKNGKRLAYLLFVEPRVSGDNIIEESYVPDSSWLNEIWKGIIIRSGNLLHGDGYPLLRKYVGSGDRTLIGSSRYYTSNPDLVNRLKNGYFLTQYDGPTFYRVMTNEGYLTSPNCGETVYKQEILSSVPKPLAQD
ncbi:DEKNAAC103222 [Brettanomyces naardenensis]|uniref:DEKNAAC103222 n=1 Tax=Brettanomyces naardenensis TaxID=13370 RepID=A0A448YMN6_BRENA|nr:DEKNAAC103222 [Brettanomyces naardenensis]